jgi:hypothetical protein
MFVREDMADIRVSVDGVPYGDSWYSAEGANLEADDSHTRPGGMGYEVSLGGPASRDDYTIETQLTDVVMGWHKTLEQKVGESAPAKVGITFLNRLRQPVGASHTVVGTLKSARLPDMDTGGNDAAMYQIIVSCDERAA